MVQPQFYSTYVYRIERLLKAAFIRVHLYNKDLPCVGMWDSDSRQVFINEADARGALLTLAHEAGHWLGYEVFGQRNHSYQRERQAFVYGWRILILVGAANNVISREEWMEEERERKAAPDVDTDHFERAL